MTWRDVVVRLGRRLEVPTLALAGLLLAGDASAQTGAPFDLNVQTHFSQGWDLDRMPLVSAFGAEGFRDGIYWSKIETARGVYDYASVAEYLERARELGLRPMPVFAGTNPLYDDGNTPHTDAGRLAFARYVADAVASHPDLFTRIEIGNEYNTNGFVKGPFRDDPGQYLALLLQAVHTEVRAVAPDTEILCSGAHSISTGFFRRMFEFGALENCDAISLHPYRPVPEHLDVEIARLQDMMRQNGREIPIYATEFGKWFDSPEEAPDYMFKMVALMSDAGLRGAYWYALVDQPWWPNMGLVDEALADMPAAPAYRFLQELLAEYGRPRAVGPGGLDRIFAFGAGSDAYVVWGAPGRLVVDGEARFFDTRGREIAPVEAVTDTPVVLTGKGLRLRISRAEPLYDSFYQFGAAPWSYHAHPPGDGIVDLALTDWNWNPFIGDKYLKPLAVRNDRIVAVSLEAGPYTVIERFTAPRAGGFRVTGAWTRVGDATDAALFEIALNGTSVVEAELGDEAFQLDDWEVPLESGDTLDFSIGPNASGDAQVVARQIRIAGP